MRKTDKKIDNTIRQALTNACEVALDRVEGFKWLTHLVNYNNYPESLAVICVFDSNSDLAKARTAQEDELLRVLIKENLVSAGIALRDVRKQISFDTEEACTKENGGKWSDRLSRV
jgi:hypothetical protein